ncbi:zinc-finger associated domain containing protein, partial [Oryctes borbonicus]
MVYISSIMATPKAKSNVLEMVCRACLKVSKNRLNIFEHRTNDKLVVDMIIDCTSVTIQSGDGYPINICSDCMELLYSAYNFKKMVVQSNVKLVNFYNRKNSQNNNTDDEDVKDELFIKNEQVDSLITTDGVLGEAVLIVDDHQQGEKTVSSEITNFCCKSEDPSQNQMTIKEELFVEKLDGTVIQAQYSSDSDDDNVLFDESNSDSSSSDESSEVECKNEEIRDENERKSRRPTGREGKNAKNLRNHNEKQAEMLDNPDYQRIINSGLSKKQKDRETV